MVFYRTRGGWVVHAEDCPVLRRTKEKFRWEWAEREGITTKEQMREYLEMFSWLKPCRVCFPYRR